MEHVAGAKMAMTTTLRWFRIRFLDSVDIAEIWIDGFGNKTNRMNTRMGLVKTWEGLGTIRLRVECIPPKFALGTDNVLEFKHTY